MSAVFVFEMLVGCFMTRGADPATATSLLETFSSPDIFAVILPSLLAFFVGTGLFVWSLVPFSATTRWPTLVFALGAALILAEILLAQVVLSQIGNILILVAGVRFGVLILRSEALPSP